MPLLRSSTHLAAGFVLVSCSGASLPPVGTSSSDGGGPETGAQPDASPRDGAGDHARGDAGSDAGGDARQDGIATWDAGRDGSADGPARFDAVFRDAYEAIDAGANLCTKATPLQFHDWLLDFTATTTGGTHELDPPCASGTGPDAFFKLELAAPAFLYADTLGATWDTVLFLMDSSCSPIRASTTPGDAVCSDNACGGQQSQLVALLKPGVYVLGLTGAAGASGSALVHLEFTLAASGTETQLPKGVSVQQGVTSGQEGNVGGESAACIAAGPEDGYWWASCPDDTGGTLMASTCGGSDWETVLEVEIPASTPYACALDTCGMQSSLTGTIPAGAGFRLLLVDGEGGNSSGTYTMNVSRP